MTPNGSDVLPKTELGKVQISVLRDQLLADRSAVRETPLVQRMRELPPAERAALLIDELAKLLNSEIVKALASPEVIGWGRVRL